VRVIIVRKKKKKYNSNVCLNKLRVIEDNLPKQEVFISTKYYVDIIDETKQNIFRTIMFIRAWCTSNIDTASCIFKNDIFFTNCLCVPILLSIFYVGIVHTL